MTKNTNDTAYDFVKQVELDLDILGLEESQVSLDVDMYTEDNTVTLEYKIEAMDWAKEYLDKEPASHMGRYSFTSDEELVPNTEQMREFLDDNFLETALRLDNEVIRESPSPEYDAF